MIGTEDRYWQKVPKVSVLPCQRRAPSRDIFLRALLAVVVLVGVYLVWNQWNARAEINDRITQKSSELRRLQGSLSRQRQVVEGLHVQINELQQQQEDIDLVTAGSIDWYASMTSLFGAQPSGVIFESVGADEDGKVILEGLATEPGSKSSLPTQFSRISGILDFQGIEWAEGSETTTFSATFQVRP